MTNSTKSWSAPLEAKITADDDQKTLKYLITHMEEEHLRNLSSQEKILETQGFLPSVKHGDGIVALLRQHADQNVPHADTAHALDGETADVRVVKYYMKLLKNAAEKSKLTDPDLTELYTRNQNRKLALNA